MTSTKLSTKYSLTYDDVQLVPAFSEIGSRSDITLDTQLTRQYTLDIPLIASPMDTVCESAMAISMYRAGGVGCIHRFMTVTQQVAEVEATKRVISNSYSIGVLAGKIQHDFSTIPIMAAIGANGDYLERAQELVTAGTNILVIDVAHGHHILVKEALSKLKASLPSTVDIVAGNIATMQAALDLQFWGADALRVGIGGGSLCTTRIKTGFGVPNVSSLAEVVEVAEVPVWACGGIRNSGDIAKALAVGASAVVLGSLLAGTKESPGPVIDRGTQGLFKRYRGAASLETKITHGISERNVEGESTVVPFKGGVKYVVEGLLDGVRSALSYAGAANLKEFHPEYVIVTSAGITEARPHLL